MYALRLDDYLTLNGMRELSSALSAASVVLRFLLRHCPVLAAVKDDNGNTLYDRSSPSSRECEVCLCPSPAVSGGRFIVAVSWSAAGDEL